MDDDDGATTEAADGDPDADDGLEARETPGGETVYVDRRDGDTGSKAPFLVVYRTADRERKYGWFCGHCESLDNAMDSMGRIECNECGNFRKPTDWDAAHE